jgi:hypothetical protein
MFVLVGEGVIMSARLVTCATAGTFRFDSLFETQSKTLENALEPERFTF